MFQHSELGEYTHSPHCLPADPGLPPLPCTEAIESPSRPPHEEANAPPPHEGLAPCITASLERLSTGRPHNSLPHEDRPAHSIALPTNGVSTTEVSPTTSRGCRLNPLSKEWTPGPKSLDQLDLLVAAAAARFDASNTWAEFVSQSRDPVSNFHEDVSRLPHPAAHLLDQFQTSGAPAIMTTSKWSAERIQQALARGPHQSAMAYVDFLREDFVDMINKGHWTILPARLVQQDPNLRLSPLGVVPQRERRPRPICDYTFHGVNPETLPLVPPEAMQFGKALQRLLHKIHQAHPWYGPVYLCKIDIPKLGVLFPTRSGEEQLITFPLTLPMGWRESPPYFSTATETVADLSNDSIRNRTPMAPHRLDLLAEAPIPTTAAPPALANQHTIPTTATPSD
jgi:hypothetical protein